MLTRNYFDKQGNRFDVILDVSPSLMRFVYLYLILSENA
jgi:hypothetical protein